MPSKNAAEKQLTSIIEREKSEGEKSEGEKSERERARQSKTERERERKREREAGTNHGAREVFTGNPLLPRRP